MIRFQVAGLLGVLGCLASCVDINGGAVELRWQIRKMDGRSTYCGDTQVYRVQLCATPFPATVGAGEPDAGQYCRSWACSDYQGSTPFDIPPGRYSLEMKPVCHDGSDPKASMPDPIVRDISNGNVAELNTLLIVMVVKPDEEAFICPTP